MDLEKLFSEFVQSGLYLRGWSTKTPVIYRRAFTSFQQSLREGASVTLTLPPDDASLLTKAQLEAWIVQCRQRGLSPAGCNIFISAMNAFCSWPKEQGYVREQLRLGPLKSHSKPVQVFSEAEIKLLLAHKPKRLVHLRTWVLITTLLDTGCRIDEVLTLERANLDFDNLLITVNGKGGKIRRIPFSHDLRRHLWTFCQHSKTSSRFVFCARSGAPLTYRNTYRDIKACFQKAGVSGEHVHPHNLRHTFAYHFMKNGASIYTLSRILGHSSITTTQTYLRGLGGEDLQEGHSRMSPLVRAR